MPRTCDRTLFPTNEQNGELISREESKTVGPVFKILSKGSEEKDKNMKTERQFSSLLKREVPYISYSREAVKFKISYKHFFQS